MCASRYNHLVVSDLHIGGGVHVAERRLAEFTNWYASHPVDGRPWRLIIAGDGIDFLHASLGDGHEDNCEDQAVETLEAIVGEARSTFEALAAFVAEGHEVVFVGGNHDAELHWDRVQTRLRSLLSEILVERLRGRTADVAVIRSFELRIRVCRWFFFEKDVLYVEHGHQYDELCSFENVLYPVEAPLSHVTLRKFRDLVHRLDPNFEEWSLVDFLRWAVALPRLALVKSAVTYLQSPKWLFGLERRMSRPRGEAGQVVKDRIREIVEAFGVDETMLARLDENHRAPAGRRWTSGLTMLFYDQIALFAMCAMLLTGCTVAPLSFAARAAFGSVLLGSTVIMSRRLGRRRSVAAHDKLVDGARAVARVVDVPWVVFGHSHVPAVSHVADETTYVNTGSWTNEGSHGLSHFRQTAGEGGLFRWNPLTGRPDSFGGATGVEARR